ncbi:MAG TPA: DUF3293 domain-containing protein [Limnobacter sp.]|nr:DUF3293 domain-containing protein [Limnobacter sp.]
MPDSTVNPDTVRAYAETEYHVSALVPFTLKVGQYSPELKQAYADMEAGTAFFITPCNPYSKILPNEENLELQQRLASELAEHKLKFLNAVGKHPESDWPGEAGYLVFGLTPEEANAMGMRWQQNAIVYCKADAVPRLVLLR